MNIKECVASLNNGTLSTKLETVTVPEAGVILVGALKLAPGEEQHVQFLPSAEGSHWLSIPHELIEEVEPLGAISSHGDGLDLVLLQLRAPNTPEAKLLTGLLQGASQQLTDMARWLDEQASASDRESEALTVQQEGFGLPSIRPPKFHPPRVVIPPLVPKQIDRISRFSSCAKCKMYVELAIAGVIAAAFAAAGAGAGPSFIAALKLALQREFGAAAAEAALAAVVSRHNSAAAQIICRVNRKC